METVLAMCLLVAGLFGWFQTERLEDTKQELQDTRETSLHNYMEYKKVSKANGNLKDNLDSLESSLNQCTNDIDSMVNEINVWEEATKIQEKEINRLESDLETLDYSDNCRLPDNLDIETYRSP